MTIRWQPKLPAETRDYTHDWSPYLGDDTIASEVHSADGVTLDSVEVLTDDDAGKVKFWVSDGTEGIATVTQTITTAGGRVESETFYLPISADEEPLSLAEAKAQVRVLDDNEDAYIESLIPAARRYVENRSGIIIKRRQFVERHLPERGAIRLYNGPVVSVEPLTYLDSSGDGATYDGARFFVGSSFLFPALGESWPSPYAGESFTITYTAGLSAEELAADEYSNLIHAMKLLIGHWHSNRSAAGENPAKEIELGVNALCDQVRIPLA